MAGSGEVRQSGSGPASLGKAGNGSVRQSGQGKAGQGVAWSGKAVRGCAWQGLAGRKNLFKCSEQKTNIIFNRPRRVRKVITMIKTLEKPTTKATTKTSTGRSASKTKEEPIQVYSMNIVEMILNVVGETPLIVHKFSEKSLRMIEEKQQGKGKTKEKANRKPEEEFNQARYIIDKKNNIDGFPASAFKKAAVRAGTYQDHKMTFLRGAFHVIGDLLPIKSVAPTMRTDTVRIGNGVCDIRYRPEYKQWGCAIPIKYNASVISAEQIVNLFEIAGFAVGIGDWRPEKDGQFGTFKVSVS